MRQELYCRSLVIASALAASAAPAQPTSPDNPSRIRVEADTPVSPNRFGLNYRMGFNISAKFKSLGGYPTLSNPGLTPDGQPWNYDNGYVLEDKQGNASSLTWNWGYSGLPSSTGLPRRDAQLSPDGQFLFLSRSSASADVSSGDNQSDPQSGLELTYNRELGRSGKTSWGLEGAANYMNVSIRDNRTLYGSVTRQTDAYAFPPNPAPPPTYVTPPDPPYYGDFNGPVPGGPTRPVISQTPTAGQGFSTIVPDGVTIAGERKFQANVYGFRVGPYLEIPLSKKVALSLSGGLAVVSVSSQFSFNETVTIPGIPISGPGQNNVATHSGSGSHSGLLFGGYASGSFSYAFNKAWSAALGAQYQNVGRLSQQVGSKQAELDLSKTIFVTVGVGYSF